MDDLPVEIQIGVQFILPRITEVEGTEAKLREAMKCADESCWMSVNEEYNFKAAVGAVLVDIGIDHEDYPRITRELEILRGLGAASSGVPVDFGALLEGAVGHKPFGLTRMWSSRNDLT